MMSSRRTFAIGLSALALIAAAIPVGSARAATPPTPINAGGRPLDLISQARWFIENKDFLGFRVFIKKAYWKKITYGEWWYLKNIINANVANAGFDLVQVWNVRNPGGKSNLDKTLEYADSLMLNRRFNEAFTEYQKMADYLKKLKAHLRGQKGRVYQERYNDADSLYSFVLHCMARALYGAGRYDDSLVVYSWLAPTYPRFRQVLFEKMWAAFRAGRVEAALGAVASQRSAYFSTYLSPEAYLIQTYIYRKLCRNDDMEQVMKEMKAYEATLRKEDPSDWARGDLETLVLWNLLNTPGPRPVPLVTPADREKEKHDIRVALNRVYKLVRGKLLNDLKTAMAYSHLAGVTDTTAALKPVERLTSREALARLDLEVWPADSSEEWADEVGRHYFLGNSLCGTNR